MQNVYNSIDIHLYSIIILHGMYVSNDSLFNTAKFIQENNKNIKVILPAAPTRDIDWPNGKEYNVSSWYNFYTRKDGELEHDIINIREFNKEKKRIQEIIQHEINLLHGKSNNVIIAGISQGGTLALNIALTNNYKLGGVIGIHTVFLDYLINNYHELNNIPIYLFSGKNDKIYNIKLQKKSLVHLKHYDNISWNIEQNLGHCEYSIKENIFMINSINNIINRINIINTTNI